MTDLERCQQVHLMAPMASGLGVHTILANGFEEETVLFRLPLRSVEMRI